MDVAHTGQIVFSWSKILAAGQRPIQGLRSSTLDPLITSFMLGFAALTRNLQYYNQVEF